MARKSKKKNQDKLYYEIIGIILIAIGIFAFTSLYTHSTGLLGRDFRDLLLGLFGFVSYVIPFLIAITGVLIIASYSKKMNYKKLSIVITTIYSSIALIHMFSVIKLDQRTFASFIKSSFDYGQVNGSGAGVIGALPVFPLIILLGTAGTYILLITMILIGIILLTNLSLHKVGKDMGFKIASKVREVKEKKLFVGKISDVKADEISPSQNLRSMEPVLIVEEEKSLDDIKIIDNGKSLNSELPIITEHDDTRQQYRAAENKSEKKPSIPEPKEEELSIEYHKKSDNVNTYCIPPLDLLASPVIKKGVKTSKDDFKENAKILEETLSSFNVSAKVLQISRGPAITRYELQPAPGIKVSRIVNLADDIALNLASSGVRIEAPIPGKSAIGVEVPNSNIATVLIREVLESNEFTQHPSRISFCLGKDIAGKNVVADLAKMPHLLIAGATGAGKSVCINSLITSILYKSTPDEVRMIMIDPKVVELSTYNGIPHLLIPVVTDPKKAAGALNWAIQEMTSRYKTFADKGVRDMQRYNEVAEKENETKLPQIIVIIDELADLMMVAPNDVEDAICRLAQMARAAGIHLVIATQRPSVDVITGVIKANIPSRIAFAVSSQTDSRTILDMGGAEKLLGRGDMLFSPVGASKPIRIQGAYVSEKEVEDVVENIKGQIEPNYDPDILEEIAVSDEPYNDDQDNYDQLLPDAIELVLENNQASISMLQRRLRVGYARAARLIDEMEQRGIVSGFDGSKPRNVLISKEDFQRMFGDEQK